MTLPIKYTLTFRGREADNNAIEFYDAAEALSGFQRSLALTTHLILNGEIIVQAPALKGAILYAGIPEQGSWKFMTWVSMVATGAYMLGTAPKDTALGHLVVSAYDYVVSESLGFNVDFNSTLGEQYKKLKKSEVPVAQITEAKMDALIEKCETSIKAIHRPIVASHTANTAVITSQLKRMKRDTEEFNSETFDYINVTTQEETPIRLYGKVSSYNMNNFSGRIFDLSEVRPVPFLLADNVRSSAAVSMITRSLDANAQNRWGDNGIISFRAFRNVSSTGRLKSLTVVGVEQPASIPAELLPSVRKPTTRFIAGTTLGTTGTLLIGSSNEEE